MKSVSFDYCVYLTFHLFLKGAHPNLELSLVMLRSFCSESMAASGGLFMVAGNQTQVIWKSSKRF